MPDTSPEIVTYGTGADEVLPAGRCSDDAILVLSRRAASSRVVYHPEVFTPSDGRWRGADGHHLGGLTPSDRWMVIDPTARADRPGGPKDIADTLDIIAPLNSGETISDRVMLIREQRDSTRKSALAATGALRTLLESVGADPLPGSDMTEVVMKIAERGGFTWDGEL